MLQTSGRTAVAGCLLALAACGGGPGIPERDALVRVDVDVADVELGKAFPLTVVRVWRKDLVPGEWSDRALAPLVARLDARDRRDDGVRIEETLRFRCWAFAPGDVAVAGAAFTVTPAGGGAERTISTRPVRLRVHPSLDPAAPGDPELPGGLLTPPRRWPLWAGAGAFAVLAALVAVRTHRRRRPAPPAPAEVPAGPPPPGPHERALAQIRALRGPGGPDDDLFHVGLSAVVRAYVEERFDLRAPEMTTEEFVASPRAAELLSQPHRTLLGNFLTRCDLVKFAQHAATDADRTRLLDEAERFVAETAPPERAA